MIVVYDHGILVRFFQAGVPKLYIFLDADFDDVVSKSERVVLRRFQILVDWAFNIVRLLICAKAIWFNLEGFEP